MLSKNDMLSKTISLAVGFNLNLLDYEENKRVCNFENPTFV